MERTFDNYTVELDEALSKLTDQQKFFFGVWCCEYLYQKYARHIPEKLSQEAYEQVTEIRDFLWQSVDGFDSFEEDDAVYDYVEALREIDPEEALVPDDPIEGNISNLLGSLEDVTSYLLQRDDELVASGSENIVNEMDLLMIHELQLDTSDPDKLFTYPKLEEELDREFALLQQLKEGAVLTSKDKNILR